MTTPLGDCDFYAQANDSGLFVGRCRQFPDLRSKPRRSRLDAVDDIISVTKEKLRHLDAALANQEARA